MAASRSQTWRTALLTAGACVLGLLVGRAGVLGPAARLERSAPLAGSPRGGAGGGAAGDRGGSGSSPLGAPAGPIPLSQLELLAEDVREEPEPPQFEPAPRFHVHTVADGAEWSGVASDRSRARGARFGSPAEGAVDGTRRARVSPGADDGAPGRASAVPTPSGGFPTLFVLGTSKGGSTFLFDCLAAALHPRAVCGSERAADWLGPGCAGRGKRFLLPAARLNIHRRELSGPTRISANPIKENYILTRSMYHGPPSAVERQAYYRGPKLPLQLWELATVRLAERQHPPPPMEPREVSSIIGSLLRACAAHAGNGGLTAPVGGGEAVGCPVMARRGEVHRWRTQDKRVGEACGFRLPSTHPVFRAAPPEALVAALCGAGRRAGGRGGTGSAAGLNVSAQLGPDTYLSDVRAFPALPDAARPDFPGLSDTALSDPSDPDRTKSGEPSPIIGIDACPYYLAEASAPAMLRAIAPPSLVRAAPRRRAAAPAALLPCRVRCCRRKRWRPLPAIAAAPLRSRRPTASCQPMPSTPRPALLPSPPASNARAARPGSRCV